MPDRNVSQTIFNNACGTRMFPSVSKLVSFIQFVQTLQGSNNALQLCFCNLINGNCIIYKYILFTDETQINRDEVNNCRNERHWSDENPYSTLESNLQHRFGISVWWDMINNQLVGTVIRARYLKFDSSMDDRYKSNIYFQYDSVLPHFNRVIMLWSII